VSPEARNRFRNFAIAAAALLLAFLSGKYFTPKRVEEKEKKVVASSSSSTAVDEHLAIIQQLRAENERLREQTRTVTTTVKLPDGTVRRRKVQERNVERETNASQQTAAAAAEKAVETKQETRVEYVERTKTVDRYDPWLKLGLVGGVGFQGSLAAVGGVQAGARAGPLWFTGQIQTDARTRIDVLLGIALEL
jgi:hypothetical protein